MEENLIIRYIYHSGFALEFSDKIVIFDYYKGALPANPKDKDVIFVVSHAHYDHFNRKIFDYDRASKVSYVVSKDVYDEIMDFKKDGNIIYLDDDIEKQKNMLNSDIHLLKSGESLFIDDIKFMGLGSTDKGISIYMQANMLFIFFAGDLNNWIFPDDSDEKRRQMQKYFSKEIDKLDHVDIGFFPVDPRLKENYDLGVNEFMEKTHAKVLFPMHFTKDPSTIDKFLREHNYPGSKIIALKNEGESFQIIIR